MMEMELLLGTPVAFQFNSVNAYNGLSIVPSKMIALLNTCKFDDQSWKYKLKIFIDFYKDDLQNPLALDV